MDTLTALRQAQIDAGTIRLAADLMDGGPQDDRLRRGIGATAGGLTRTLRTLGATAALAGVLATAGMVVAQPAQAAERPAAVVAAPRPTPKPAPALRPSQVTPIYLADTEDGRIWVVAKVEHYVTATHTWRPSQLSPLYVQVLTRRGWRTVRTLTTGRDGFAYGFAVTGPGVFVVRLVRPQGATVKAAATEAFVVTVTTGYLDVD